jgi:hypothetical protein
MIIPYVSRVLSWTHEEVEMNDRTKVVPSRVWITSVEDLNRTVRSINMGIYVQVNARKEAICNSLCFHMPAV